MLKPGSRFAVSDIVLFSDLLEKIRSGVSAYVGCIARGSLMGEYVRLPLEAGLLDLTIPQIAHGLKLALVLAPGETSHAAEAI